MKKIVTIAFLSVSCGVETPSIGREQPTLTIGETRFYMEEGVEPWRDLPEVMYGLQRDYPAPEGMWDLDIVLYPEWYSLGESESKEGTVLCKYNWHLDRFDAPAIRIRVNGLSTVHGCLTHELAHRELHIAYRVSGHGPDHTRLMNDMDVIARRYGR